jgi:hypothetical protein
VIIERNRFLRPRCVDEAWPLALFRIPVKCELGDNQDGATYIRQWEVDLAFGIAEQSKSGGLLGHPVDLFRCIAVCEADEKKESLPDAPRFSIANADFCPRDPLE